MLNELEQGARTLMRVSPIPSDSNPAIQSSLQDIPYDTLMEQWQARLQYTQVSLGGRRKRKERL